MTEFSSAQYYRILPEINLKPWYENLNVNTPRKLNKSSYTTTHYNFSNITES